LTKARLRPFGTTIFAEMTRLADEPGAINLSDCKRLETLPAAAGRLREISG
jgi:hypothetical protein